MIRCTSSWIFLTKQECTHHEVCRRTLDSMEIALRGMASIFCILPPAAIDIVA